MEWDVGSYLKARECPDRIIEEETQLQWGCSTIYVARFRCLMASPGSCRARFGCHLVTHVVTKEGRLLLCRIDKTENVTEAEANDPDVFWSPTGSFRMHTSLHDSNFQGVVRFYGCEGDHRDGTWQWHDYNAKFVDGQLVTIECNMRRTD